METEPAQVEAIAEAVVALKRAFFRDVWFQTTRTGEAFSKLIDKPGGWLRFSLPEGAVLHFGSLRVWMREGDAQPTAVEEMQEITLGSTYVGTELYPKRLLDFGNTHLAFHTDNHDAHLTLRFAPGLVHRIEINNRDDRYAIRAWDLRIEISQDGETWETVYHHPDRALQFRSMARESLSHDHPVDLVEQVVEVMAAAWDQPLKVRVPFTQFGEAHGPAARAALARVLDRDILAARKFEMTSSHGAQMTFRFWEPEVKETYMRFAASAIKRLQAQGDQAFLGYGTLLGMVRDGALIPHDDDIDLVMVMDRNPGESTWNLMKRFDARLNEAGFRVTGDYPNHRHIHDEGEPKVLDVFIAVRENGRIYFNPAREHEIEETVVFPLVETEFMGSSVLVPSNVLTFLTAMYGADWHTPMPAFVHGWKPLS